MTAGRGSEAALNAICSEGLSHHQAGRLNEARRRYEQVLAVSPRHFDALHLLGVCCIQTGQLEPAVDLIGQAVAIRTDNPGAYGNLANALNGLRRHAEALDACDRAIALNPGFAEAHGNRAQALHQLGRHEDALASYARVVTLKPSAQAHFNCATVLRVLGRLDEALASYERVIALKPDYPEALRSRGVLLCQLGRPDAGLESYDRAIALKPDYADAHASRGVVLRELGRPEEALACLELAIALSPNAAEAHNSRGNTLSDLRRYEEALAGHELAIALKPDFAEAHNSRAAALRMLQRPAEALAAADRALALKPDHADAHNNRGVALHDLRRLDEALAAFDRAIALRPDSAEAFNNRGNVLYELRRLDEALAAYDQAIALKPEYAEAFYNQALCRLAAGDFAKGWAQFEWRRNPSLPGAEQPEPGAPPLWLGGEDLKGRSLLVRFEEGLGDTLQFCRYVTDVAALGAEVVFEAQPGLMRLLASLEGAGRLAPYGAELPVCDFQVPLMSLPLALGMAAPEPRGPYLRAEPELAAAWSGRMPAVGGLRVGLCWAGGFRPDELGPNAMDRRRSPGLEVFAPLAALTAASFYSLQIGPPAAELAALRDAGWSGPQILDLTPELKDFADTAAMVANLDLVITCDTAVAHLAGGLGKPVWILNRFDACWRWLHGRTDTPWYPSARIYAQPSPGDWASVIADVARDMAALGAGA